MPRFTTTDRWLLWALLPACALVLTLHVREVVRTGLAFPPVFVRPPADDAYPLVGGRRLERGLRWNDLQVGDRLIRVGEVDLRGVGYIGFDAIVLEQAGTDLRTPVVFERGGEQHRVELVMNRHTMPWFRIPFLVFLLGTAVLVLLRSPGSRQSQLFFAAFGSFVILEAPFFGGPRLQSQIALSVFNFGGAVALFLLLRWLIAFPADVPERSRLSSRLAWLGALFAVVRIPYLFATPIPTAIVPLMALASDGLIAMVAISIGTWNYVHATPIGRRRMKWSLYGGYVMVTPVILATLVSSLGLTDRPELAYDRMFQYVVLAGVALPLGNLIGIVRYNLFDIDRLISSTAAYSISAVAVVGAGFATVPVLASWLGQATGAGEKPVLAALSLTLAGVTVPLSRRLRPQIDRVFFPERRALADGIERLLRGLSRCATAPEVLGLVRDRLVSLLRPESFVFLQRGERGFGTAETETAPIALRSPLVHELEANPSPLPATPRELVRRVPNLPGSERRFLETAEVKLLIPVRSGQDLAAIVCLGARRSGDIYTATDLGLLATVAERASAELLRLQDEQAIALERVRGDHLQTLKNEAEKLNAARSRFLAAASHDLRQPLHALGFFVETLGERLPGAEDRALIERMRRSTLGLAEMLDALLDMSRLDAGVLEPHVTDFELHPVLERLASELEGPAERKGLAVLLESTRAWVRSDPVLLVRVVQNLLTNAVRYTDSGEIRLGCRSDGDDVVISVSDTGPGVPAERQAEIFGEFVQLEETGSRDGLGLGLSIVERICELLGHEVTLESKPGAGSTFRVRVAAAASKPRPGVETIRGVHLGGRLVMVLDDDLQILEGTGSLLKQWGAEVVLAASEEEALASLRTLRRRPDAILVDYRLGPGRTGLEALGEIRSFLGGDVPAAVLTGETSQASLADIRASGLPHLAKPIPPARLRALLLALMRGSPGAS